jgi:hypothetical protein
MNAPTRTTFTPGETVTKKHPIRGFFWGLMLGLGGAVVAVVTTLVTLSLMTVIAIVVVGVLIGILWGTFAPAKAPKGPEPAQRTAVVHEATRFDDFEQSRVDDDRNDDTTAEPDAEATADDTADGGAGDGDGGDD